MIMNIIHQDSGVIRILGETSIGKVLDKIGYMPEERGLYRKMTVRNVISYIGSLKSMKRNILSGAVLQWLEEMSLTAWADKKVENLSRGMQQKLQFITTVINDPELLVLDEPFSGLDPINMDLLKGIILRMRDSGKTVIFSTHMMEQAEKLCDYILLINRGEKVIDGTLDQIRSQYTSNTVSVELEGDTSFVSRLPMVKTIIKTDRRYEVSLMENVDNQEFLQALVGRVRVRVFEVKMPSLHEIFVDLVGQKR
jgi:ABC-2 type transport system ATP-binding protein